MNTAKKKSKEDGKAYLRDTFIDIEKAFIEELKRAQKQVTHSGTLGDTWEDAWIDLLKKYLPTRYKVAKAFAVDHLGKTTEQLDCLIYDAHFTPALFGKDKHQYIPAEAVYATFEVKAAVTKEDIEYAGKKTASLRALQRTSAPLTSHLGTNLAKPPLPIIGGLLTLNASWVDGLGETFLGIFTNLSGNEKLDIVLTAESGFCDHLEQGHDPEIITGEGALIRGLLRLLKALRDKATVPAVEWEKYEEVFDASAHPIIKVRTKRIKG